jgi:hypothetical protein
VHSVAPRSIIACAKSPGRSAGVSACVSADVLLRFRQRRVDGVEPRNDALDIAVDHRRRLAEGDRRDGRRRVVADAGQGAQAFGRSGNRTAMVGHHRIGAFLQVARPRIIAEPRPGFQDVVFADAAASAATSGHLAVNFAK